ncbi:VOC family protein [Gryllotalpicola koreensis]|uniref:VOC family protein n=1 Tax=Gryllotalpicola koreensis TaxID=993086 RepID=A0ABP7ZQQ1_9MICO
MTNSTGGPDFVSFQVRDIDAAAEFYEKAVGLNPLPAPNPHARVFSTGEVTFAVRTPIPGVDLDAIEQLGAGIAVWFSSDDVAGVRQRVGDAGAEIVQEPFEGPFGTTFSFRDPDGYIVTVHSAR